MTHPDYATLLTELKGLGLPADEYAVYGSGPLAVRGIRRANDVDLIVTERLYEKLEGHLLPGDGKQLSENIEAFRTWPGAPATVEELIARADIIDAIRFVRLADVAAWKAWRGRPKDLEDVGLLQRLPTR